MSLAFDDKDRVKQATDIVDLIGHYLPLRRQGAKYVALCPWHQDTKPSLQINPARQSWKCWVCDDGGDVFSFITKHENVGFREALEMLAERAGIELNNRPRVKTVAGDPSDKPTLFRAMEWASDQYHRCLLNDDAAEPARRYLAARGINDAAINEFKIGFAPNSWSWLIDRSKSSGFSSQVLQACGIVARSERTSGWYERFRGRVMFPIHDTQDRCIAFGGRVLPEIAEAEEKETGRPPAKYINSPETKLYSKSENLFALNIARKSLASDPHLIIVEGYTDVIGSWIAGVENVAAVCGTALNQRHIQVIKRFADRITLVLDGDDAGQRRTNEVLEHFVAADVDLRILTLPQGSDPCDFVQSQGANEFRKLIDGARDALDHKVMIETVGIDLIRDTHRANQALNRILQTIAGSPISLNTSSESRLKIQQVLTRLSRLFQVDLQSLRDQISQLRKKKRPRDGDFGGKSAAEPNTGNTKTLVPLESELLQILLRSAELIDRAIENISPGQFVEGPCREIYELICQCYHDGEQINFDSLMLQLEDARLRNILDRLDHESQIKVQLSEVDLSDQVNHLIAAFQNKDHDLEKRQAISDLNQPELDQQEEARILEQLFQQAKERQGIQ